MRSEITLTTSIVVEPNNKTKNNKNNSNNNNNGSLRIDSGPADTKGAKTRSLQRTATTHLYCRSLDKEAAAGALAVSQRKLASGGTSLFAGNAVSSTTAANSSSSSGSSSSRGFASCLRGEKDDTSNCGHIQDYPQKRYAGKVNETMLTIVHQRPISPQQQQQTHQLCDQIDDDLDENHPVKVLQTSLLSIGNGGETVAAGGNRKSL